MKAYRRRNSIIEGFELVTRFARTIENGHFEYRFAAAFVDVARHVLVFVEQIDGRRALNRADLACAVATLARSTDKTWRDDLKHVAATARKLEKQLGKMVQKQDPFFYESCVLEQGRAPKLQAAEGKARRAYEGAPQED